VPVLRVVDSGTVRMLPQISTCTLSGTVKSPMGVSLPRRTVRVFSDQSMATLLGSTYSLADGTFSITVHGGASSKFVCVVQGEEGENAAIFTGIVKAG